MRSRETEIKENILDILTKYGSLGYSKLYAKTTKVKDEKTFQKYLLQLVRDGFVRKRKSRENKKSTFYSIRGLELSTLNTSLKQKDKVLTNMQNELKQMIKNYLKYKKLETNSKEIQKYRLKLAKHLAVSLANIFELNQTVLFIRLVQNVPVLRKVERVYKTNLEYLQVNLKLLRKHDHDAFRETMAVSVLKSGISIPGLI
ncbi:MAG: hypothetical protein IIC67_01305 [Thaumarchaeota archaeon]|nr:hypothetical protein [Nitrososphaerota archaeon]